MKTTIDALKAYLLREGSIEFTMSNERTGVEKMYRLTRATGNGKRPWFVEVRQTESFWSYLGELYLDGGRWWRFVHGAKSKIGAQTRSVKGAKAIARWFTGDVRPPVEFSLVFGDGSQVSFALAMAISRFEETIGNVRNTR